MKAVRKFNDHCLRLASLYDPTWNLPLPLPLPVTLAGLRGSNLMEDIVVGIDGKPPPWLNDPNVRAAITAMHKQDRCEEEEDRLKFEEVNLREWLSREIAAIDHAISTTRKSSDQ